MRDGRLSCEALMEATLDRIAAVNGALNAVVSMRGAQELLAEAREADRSEPAGPLHGVPIAIKDLADAKGLPTSQGSPAFAGRIAAADSPHVAALRQAGAIVIGKTNTPEFGLGSHTYNPVHGVTANPYDLSRSCGGSSGGAAVALAAGMLSIADGSDMMGSLRNPVGWNNVYGMRPSWGRVPGGADGDVFLHRLSTNGPMARCPVDLALLLDVMSPPRTGGCRGRHSHLSVRWMATPPDCVWRGWPTGMRPWRWKMAY
ncbi:amidase family protein [Roseovarius sp. B08]|uniref:amidase family protein n=1 Tax=Roseovarius sp. B08 TaxID=3449223 RepID=UPI003EDC64AB